MQAKANEFLNNNKQLKIQLQTNKILQSEKDGDFYTMGFLLGLNLLKEKLLPIQDVMCNVWRRRRNIGPLIYQMSICRGIVAWFTPVYQSGLNSIGTSMAEDDLRGL